MTVAQIFTHAFTFFDVFGVVLAGVLGGMVAREERFDLVGFVALAVMVALGGGMLRDALLQKGPPVALTNPFYIGGAFLGALIAFAMRMTGKWWNRFFIVADAFVVSTWAATGAAKALDNGLGVMPALLLGCLTAVGGSMIRDVSVGETPAVFGGNKLYAVPALCAAGTAVCVVRGGLPEAYALLAATLVGASTCLMAYWRSWRLPVAGDRERRRAERLAAGDPTLAARARGLTGRYGGTVRSGWRRALLSRRQVPRPLRRRKPLDVEDL
mgnify:CR=1 FL=1